jgi:hypothetical protein
VQVDVVLLMPEPDPPAVLPHQVLADPTGRRRRRVAIAGRVAATALGLWLVVLILGGLGLQPLAGLPLIGRLGVREAAPPALPERVQAAVARGATVAPTTRAAQTPVTTVPVPSRRPAVTAPSRAKTRPLARTTPTTGAKHTNTTPGRAPTSPAPATSPTTTKTSSTAPGQTKTGTSPSSTAPGQTRTAPGQTKTGTGPPATTPGTTPRAKAKSYSAKGTVTVP